MKKTFFLFPIFSLCFQFSAQGQENCLDIDLTQSTFKSLPVQEQIGGTCYAYTAANMMSSLVTASNATHSTEICSPLEMAATDRLERVLRNPVGSISSDPFDVELASQLSGGDTCQSLNGVLKRQNCCKKFLFEDHLGLPPELESPKGLIDGLISLFQSDDLNSDILADHQNNRKKLAPKLKDHNQSVHNLRSVVQQAQIKQFDKKGWPSELIPTLENFKNQYHIKPFDYENLPGLTQSQLHSFYEDQQKIQQHPAFQKQFTTSMNQALASLSNPKTRNSFLTSLKKEKINIDPIKDVDFELLDEVRAEDQRISERILSFFKNKLEKCKTEGTYSNPIADVTVVELLQDFNRIDQMIPSIDPSLPPDPLIVLYQVIQKSCIPLAQSPIGSDRKCTSIKNNSKKHDLPLIAQSLQNKTPVGMSFCSKVLFNSDPNSVPASTQSQDQCGGHAVTLIGMRKTKDGRCQLRIRNSWGSNCRPYQGKTHLECVTQGPYAGDVWADADAVFDRKSLLSLEIIK